MWSRWRGTPCFIHLFMRWVQLWLTSPCLPSSHAAQSCPGTGLSCGSDSSLGMGRGLLIRDQELQGVAGERQQVGGGAL